MKKLQQIDAKLARCATNNPRTCKVYHINVNLSNFKLRATSSAPLSDKTNRATLPLQPTLVEMGLNLLQTLGTPSKGMLYY